jgi:hypothetical protein
MTNIQRRNTKPDKMVNLFAAAIRSANTAETATFT